MNLLAVVPLGAGGWIRWTARILGLLVALFVLAWDIGGVVTIVTERSWDPLQFVQGLVFLWVAAIMVLAWRWEKLGGLLGVLAGIAIAILLTVEPERRVYLLLVVALPIVVIAGAFLITDRKLRPQ